MKNIDIKKSYRRLLGFVVIFLVMNCNSSKNMIVSKEDMEWKLVKVDKKNDVPSWKIYSRKLADSKLHEYKIEGDIRSTPKECVFSFRNDIYKEANKPKNKKYPTYNILKESKDSILTYVIHNEPFIFKDTEMRIRYTFFSDGENNKENVKWIESWDEKEAPPLSKKLSRVESFRGSWAFSKISVNESKAINIVQFDPKGMPMWLVKPMVVNFMKKGFETIGRFVIHSNTKR